MSADLLREAAAMIRADYLREDVDDVAAAHFHLAVADLLDLAATHQVAFTPVVRPRLLDVARAYLGDDL